jgi:transcriptional regulator with XRE-family HTH domain
MASRDFDTSGHPRRVFGAMLRYYRTRAGLSQEELGTRIYLSDDMIGKVESGRRTLREEHTAACDTELNTGGALSELREQLKDMLKMRAYPGWFQEWPVKEAEATALRWYEPLMVPGLLQTEDYARALLRTRVGDTDDQIDEMVAARMDRQAVLAREKPPNLWAVIDEGVLRRPVGSGKVMHDQLLRLVEIARRRGIVLQVVPAAVGAYAGLRGPFVLAGFGDAPELAWQDAAVFGQFVEDAAGIAAVAAAWDTIKSEALPRRASLELVEEVAEQWT